MIDCPPAEVRVIDGDTLECRGITYRLMGLDAPELHGRCTLERALAQAASATLRGEAARCGVQLEPSPRHERWGRTLAWARVCGRAVDRLLIDLGLARPYAGGRRQPWCTTPVPRPRPRP